MVSRLESKKQQVSIPANHSGKQIKLALIHRGMKQADLAAALSENHNYEMSQKAISSIESGKRSVSDVELVLFSKVLGVSITWILSGILEEL
jgi:transcriptional regulator with XRE-family HTH domain